MADFGHYSLTLALLLALGTAGIGYTRSRSEEWAAHLGSLTIGQFVFVAIAFVSLIWSFVNDDFSIAYVANHSNSLLPWYYKVSAVWGGHEGSFVLWILFLTGWSTMVVLRRHNYPVQLLSLIHI